MRARPAAVAVLLAGLALAGCTPAQGGARSFASPAGSAMVPASPATSSCKVVDGRADYRCTPGALNRQVTEGNISQTICKSGWTATIRPPVSYTNALKAQQMAQYGEPGPASLYEEDHEISLELGGDPRDPRNLWPEPYAGTTGARTKDREENDLNRAVCSGRMTLADAQLKILHDWTRP